MEEGSPCGSKSLKLEAEPHETYVGHYMGSLSGEMSLKVCRQSPARWTVIKQGSLEALGTPCLYLISQSGRDQPIHDI